MYRTRRRASVHAVLAWGFAIRQKVGIVLVQVVIVLFLGLTINAFMKGQPFTGGKGTYPFVSYPMYSKKRGETQKIVVVKFAFKTASGEELYTGPQWFEHYGMQSHGFNRYKKKITKTGRRGLKALVTRINKVREADPVVSATVEIQEWRMAARTHEPVGEPRRIEYATKGKAP